MDKDRKKPYTEPIYDKRLLFRHFQGVGAPFRGLSLSPSHLGGGFCIQATLKEQYKVQEFYHYYNMVTKTALKIILIYARDSPAEIRNNYKAGPFGSSLITSNLLSDGNILVYTPEHIANMTTNLSNNLYLPNERKEEMSQFLVRHGDLIFPIVGSLGRAMFISDEMPEGIINQRLAKFRLKENLVDKNFFIYYFVKFNLVKEYIDVNSRGAIIVNLTKDIVTSMY